MQPHEIAQEVITRTPAYRRYLEEKTGCIPQINDREGFDQLPFMTKADYILKYELPDLCLDGSPAGSHLWLRSSGTSRKPFFWPRRYEDEKNLPMGLKRLFHRYTSPEVQPTLIVVGLALGPWGTGMQSSFAFRLVARDVEGMAVVSPGLMNESILEVLTKLSPLYKQTLLLSYPPFARMVLEEAVERGINLKELNLQVMVGGESISERYRETMWDLLGHTPKDLGTVWSLYGSTDFANVGYENPLTITIRRSIEENGLTEKFFGTTSLPMLFQQIPTPTFFEEVEEELVVSRIQCVPLVRYRTGDHVQFFSRRELLDKLLDCGVDAEKHVAELGYNEPAMEAPLVALHGRIDHTVFFYGAKIWLEQIKTALEAPTLSAYYNGRFLVRGGETEKGYPEIEIALEDTEPLRSIDLEQLTELIATELDRVQSEFREVRKMFPDRPHLRITPSPPSVFELGWKTRHM